MSSEERGGLLRRVLQEHRRVMLPLLLVLIADVLVYGLAVHPLAQRVANIQERDRSAERTLAEARLEYDSARGTLTGKQRASTELTTFYRDVLPQNLTAARRLTFLRVLQLARQSHLEFISQKAEPVEERGSILTRLKVDTVWRGTYDDVRAFLHEMETAPEFVVIDDIGLAEGSESQGDLVLTVELSTYFRGAAQ
jgi:hypothetical protein